METLENIKQYYSLGKDFEDDFFAREHLSDQIQDRLEKSEKELNSYYFYSLKITKIPTRINYHHFNFEKLQDISRKLTNGMTTFGTIPNRVFFKKYFLGGVRTISINQEINNDYPSFNLNYLVFSNLDNLDVRITNQLITRLRMIDPSLEMSMTFIGSFDKVQISKDLDYSTNVDFSSDILKKLGESNLHDIFNNQFQRPRYFGKLFKTKSL